MCQKNIATRLQLRPRTLLAVISILSPFLLAPKASVLADEALVKALQELDSRVCPGKDEQKLLTEMLGADIRKLRTFYQESETKEWGKIKTKLGPSSHYV